MPDEFLAKLDLKTYNLNKILENNKNGKQEKVVFFEPIEDAELPF